MDLGSLLRRPCLPYWRLLFRIGYHRTGGIIDRVSGDVCCILGGNHPFGRNAKKGKFALRT